MTLLFYVHQNGELDGYNYALVDLTPELARQILERRNVFSAAPEAVELHFYGCEATFLSDMPEEIDNAETFKGLDSDGYVEVNDLDVAAAERWAERTECGRMIIASHGAYWNAIAKHTDVWVETQALPYDVVEAVAQQK